MQKLGGVLKLSFNAVHPEPNYDISDEDRDGEDEDGGGSNVRKPGATLETLDALRDELYTAGDTPRVKTHTLWQRLDLKPLNPEGDWRRSIETLSLAAGIYSLFAIPFLLCTQYKSPPVVLLVGSALADFTLLFYVLASFVTGVHKGPVGSGEYIDKFRECAMHYLRRGGFPLDLITALPCTLLIFVEFRQGNSPTRMAILDVLQGLKLLRSLRVYGEVQSTFRRSPTRIELITFCTSVVLVLLCLNGVTCLWLAVVASTGPIGGLVAECSGPIHIANSTVPLTKRYGCSLFMSLQTLLSVGHGRVSEGEGVEAIEAFGMLCFIVLLAPTIHTIRWFSREITTHHSHHMASRDAVLAFMRHRNVPEAIRARAIQHFAFTWNVLQGGADVDAPTLALLPPGLRTQGLKHLHASAFATIPVFKHTGKYDAFWRALLEKAEVRKYLKGDVIVRRGDVLGALFVLKSGEVNEMNEVGAVHKVRRLPSTWGEHVWFDVVKGEMKRGKVEIHAGSGVEVFVLTRQLLRWMLTRDTYMGEMAMQYIEEQGAIQASEKFRRLWWGLRRAKARGEKAEFKAKRLRLTQRPGAAGMLR